MPGFHKLFSGVLHKLLAKTFVLTLLDKRLRLSSFCFVHAAASMHSITLNLGDCSWYMQVVFVMAIGSELHIPSKRACRTSDQLASFGQVH